MGFNGQAKSAQFGTIQSATCNKGCLQKEGIDYKETYSSVARCDTIRLMLSIAAKNNLHLGQLDIKTAFLYGSLKEDICMKPPKGYDDDTNRVCKLLKSLYGLRGGRVRY